MNPAIIVPEKPRNFFFFSLVFPLLFVEKRVQLLMEAAGNRGGRSPEMSQRGPATQGSAAGQADGGDRFHVTGLTGGP